MRSKPEPRTDPAPDANGAGPVPLRIPFENGKKYMLPLPVPMSAEEAIQLNVEWARETRKQEALLSERREAMAAFKERLAAIHERMNELVISSETGTRKVQVEVSEWVTVETGEINVIRTDTGAVVGTRAAEASDVQMGLGLPTAPTTKPDVASDEDHVTVGDITFDDEDEGDDGDELDDGEFNPSKGLATEPEPEGEHDITPTVGLLDAAKVAADAQAEEEGA
jgi:hypothetical protein